MDGRPHKSRRRDAEAVDHINYIGKTREAEEPTKWKPSVPVNVTRDNCWDLPFILNKGIQSSSWVTSHVSEERHETKISQTLIRLE